MSALSNRPDQNEESKSEGEHANEELGEKQEESDEDEEEEEYEPRYSVKELAEMVLDFYSFLATLHYDPSDLKIPPPVGWPVECLPKGVMRRKSPRTVELMRHLPYFEQAEKSTHVHYKCMLYDYTDATEHDHVRERDKNYFESVGELESIDGDKLDPADMLILAWGYESGGHYLLLDALRGEMTVDVVRYHLLSPEPIEDFFSDLKEAYRSLKLIPCPGRETEEAAWVPEGGQRIEQSAVLAQEDKWGTELDWQFVRQVYREHGWPDAFRRKEAVRAIEDLMALKAEERDTWEEAFY
ncbi:hypothetical protein P171DRAFT_213397 [Karstenula rhodostoma CBS 690.94]|uniref:Uncharacterized protein n=1 Tax=Karstenula rhodostoma CBS 690.94 TaxID=1392251 RepID=A0A9P4PQS8_9PLEO|nr:hypothetical protein P171DRAFT_213397 [Karstenula rhodostoma CBS 690.94]